MGPGVEAADTTIKPGDIVFVVDKRGMVVLTGPAIMTGEEMIARTRGVAVRNRYSGLPAEPKILLGGQTWEQAVEANSPLLQWLEKEAIKFIRTTITEVAKPPVVAFSGGKDSLAVLLLVRKAITDEEFHVMFINTGIEFPETVENVATVVSTFGLTKQLLIGEVEENQFFRVLEQYGFVARDYRVCCKTVKLGPTTQLIDEHFPEGCLSFIGQRRYESRRRSQARRVWRNPWVPNQIGASPIHNWTALMIWLYLLQERAPFNVLYRRGFERIGCMYCPASDMSEFTSIQASHPKAWARWNEVALRIAEQRGLPKEWVKYGFWRWKNHPVPIRKMAEKLGIPLKTPSIEIAKEDITYTISSICEDSEGGKMIQGRFNQPIPLDLVTAFLPALGEVVHDLNRGFIEISLRKDETTLKYLLFEGGNFVISGTEAALENAADLLVKAVLRGILCTGCGTCLSHCAENAVILEHQHARIDKRLCSSCAACLSEKCPTLFALHRRPSKQ
jgi:phosphoadenosine phosphosulfate reductase